MPRGIALRERLLAVLRAGRLLKRASASAVANLHWVDARSLVVEGRGFADRSEHFYDRLPAQARLRLRREVWDIAQDSSGMAVPFKSDSRVLRVRWALRRKNLEMGHMPASDVSGLDLYMRDTAGAWRWAAAGRPEGASQPFVTTLIAELAGNEHTFLLYLPLYNGIKSLEIGIEAGASITPLVRSGRAIVFYGTSITQGACASRPGLSYPAILGRRLDVPVVNLGFSGNGRMEPEAMVDIAAVEAPLAFVIDTLPNMQPADLHRYEAGIALIRAKYPAVPLVLVSSIVYPDGWVRQSAQQRQRRSNEGLRLLYERLLPRDSHIHLVEPEGLLGDDGEATVDGTHPNDLGSFRIANHIEPVLKRALGHVP